MNQIVERTEAGSVSASEICQWLLSRGVPAFSTTEAAHLLGIPVDHVRQRLAAPRHRSEIVSAGRGLWIAVPPDRKEWGAPEPIAYIDAAMSIIGADYCVGWLSAAALYGASHQAPQVFQVAVDHPVSERSVGRSLLRFFVRKNVCQLPQRRISLAAGTANVAAPETVALMLASDEDLAGGLDNAATAICELAEIGCLSDVDLAHAASFFPAAAPRRLGFILEQFGESGDWPKLAEHCRLRPEAPSYLSANAKKAGRHNERWNLVENRKVDPDL